MKPIYKPKGAAAEYGDYAVNIYTGCPHRCYYCFAPQVLHRDREAFHSCVEPRKDIVRELRRQLEREQITGKLIHLCFTCDPYPKGYDTTPTREVILALKEYGNHVQILTKGDGSGDFDLLDENDWYGISISCCGKQKKAEPNAENYNRRISILTEARERGIKTWASFEPVIDAGEILWIIKRFGKFYFDKIKIGKLNYYQSDIDWAAFGRKAEAACQKAGVEYYIKDSLRAEMDKP